MAGETTNGDEYASLPREWAPSGYDVGVLDKVHEVATGELQLNDIINMGTVPAGAIAVDGYAAFDDLDTNGTPTVTVIVGDSDDPDGLLAQNTAPQAGGRADFDGAYVGVNRKTWSTKTNIQVKFDTAAATAAAGTARVVLLYYVPKGGA